MIQSEKPRDGDRIFVQVDPAMESIVPEFLNNAREDARVLRKAIEQIDYEAIVRLGHSMKGACGFGFNYLGELGASLERTARDGEFSKVCDLADALESYLERVEPVYKSG